MIYKLIFTLILIFGIKAFAYSKDNAEQTRKPSVLTSVDQAKLIQSRLVKKQLTSIVKTIKKSSL